MLCGLQVSTSGSGFTVGQYSPGPSPTMPPRHQHLTLLHNTFHSSSALGRPSESSHPSDQPRPSPGQQPRDRQTLRRAPKLKKNVTAMQPPQEVPTKNTVKHRVRRQAPPKHPSPDGSETSCESSGEGDASPCAMKGPRAAALGCHSSSPASLSPSHNNEFVFACPNLNCTPPHGL